MTDTRIPIQNIYYLLSYAWNKLEERDIVSVTPLEYKTAVDLLAKVLANGMNYVFRHGLDRGYLSHHEQTGKLRGRIDFNTTLKRTYFREPSPFCEYDELSHDILHNQIIKTTIGRLLRTEDLDDAIREELKLTDQKLRQISAITLAKKHFSLVQLHSNNSFYDFLLKVCEILYDNMLVSEEDGVAKFRDFLRDEAAMGRLFEAFVRNFYKKEQAEFDVGCEIIDWQATPIGGSSIDMLPIMRTDVSLTSPNRKIIVDTKYYLKALQVHYQKESLHSANLYQLHAYLSNVVTDANKQPKCEGILLYPTVEKELDLKYEIKGHRVGIRTINLNQDWQSIHKSLLEIIA